MGGEMIHELREAARAVADHPEMTGGYEGFVLLPVAKVAALRAALAAEQTLPNLGDDVSVLQSIVTRQRGVIADLRGQLRQQPEQREPVAIVDRRPFGPVLIVNGVTVCSWAGDKWTGYAQGVADAINAAPPPAPVAQQDDGDGLTLDRVATLEAQVANLRAKLATAQQTAVPERPCAGIGDSSCNYLASCGSVCNKCGRVHDGQRTPWARARQTTAIPTRIIDAIGEYGAACRNSRSEPEILRRWGNLIDAIRAEFGLAVKEGDDGR